MSKLILCVPGPWGSEKDLHRSLHKVPEVEINDSQLKDLKTGFAGKLEFTEQDIQLVDVFELSGATWIDKKFIAELTRHKSVVYAVSSEQSLDAARGMLTLGAALLQAGGLAIKVDSSGLTHSRQAWLEFAEEPTPLNLLKAYVTLLDEENRFVSRGMNNFGLPEAAVGSFAAIDSVSHILLGFNLDLISLNVVDPEPGDIWDMEGEIAPWILEGPLPQDTNPNDPYYNPQGTWLLTSESDLYEEDDDVDEEEVDEWYDESTPFGMLCKQADELMEEEEYDSAFSKYNEALALESGNAKIHEARALCLFNLERLDEALADINHALELDNTLAYSYETRGDIWVLKDEVDKAIADYSRAIELEPDFNDSYGKRGTLLADEKEDYDLALVDLDMAIEVDPEDAELYVKRGECWLGKDNDLRALAEFSEAVELDPENAYAFQQRGTCYFNLKKYKKAIKDYNKSIELDNEVAFCFESRGDAWNLLDEYDKAIEDYSRSIQLEREDNESFGKRGCLLADKHEYDAAIADHDIALQITPHDLDCVVSRGFCYCQQGKLDLAYADFAHAVKLEPENPIVWLNRGFVHERRKEISLAISDYEKAIKLDDQYADGYSYLSGLYYEKKDFGKALKIIKKALRVIGPFADGYICRGLVYQHTGKYDAALSDYKSALDLEPKNTNALSNCAWILSTCPEAELRDLAAAEQYAAQACELGKYKEAWPLCVLGAVLGERGDFAKAIDFTQQALSKSTEEELQDACSKMLAHFKDGKPYRDMDGEPVLFLDKVWRLFFGR
jgi:tetratricopeptide (TPR) repeat protein